METLTRWQDPTIDELRKEINQLKKRNKEIYDGYMATTQELTEYAEENERLNNIINTILDFNFFKEECPLNFGYQEECDEEKAQDVFYEKEYCENCNDDYKKCWLKYFNRLQELKENKQ